MPLLKSEPAASGFYHELRTNGSLRSFQVFVTKLGLLRNTPFVDEATGLSASPVCEAAAVG